MAHVFIPESQPDSQPSGSQRNGEYTFEATQVSQPRFSQTQNTQNTTWEGSQVEPRRKYWATFIPTNSSHSIIKLPWTKPSLQMGRGAAPVGNDVILNEKRVSNRHCRITLGIHGASTAIHEDIDAVGGMGPGSLAMAVGAARDSEAEPDVWIEDLGSSNGTFVNGQKVSPRRLLRHGDEISLGHIATLENHDVRYIFRSVGAKGSKFGQTVSHGGMGMVGEVYERYQILETLGKGTFAEVMRAVDVETGDLRAIKQIIKHRFAGNARTLALFQREIEISSSLDHENICRLIDHYEDPQHICLVLEYIDGGDLLDHITEYPNPDGGGLPEAYAANLTLQICRAMAYTHSMGVTHRDLKPENILLTKETPGNPSVIKIADFGLAKMVDAATMLKSMVGTPQYLAPEVVMQTKENVGYENVVDSWSVGIIVYSMLTKALPFDEDPEMPIEKRIRARFTQQFDTRTLEDLGITPTAIHFISCLLAKNPLERMTMSQALEHEWLAGPSSQQSASQIRHPLGGDSMWSIESFDDENHDHGLDDVGIFDNSDMDGEAQPQGWNRQVTVSATNHGQSYPSSLAGDSGAALQFGTANANGNGNATDHVLPHGNGNGDGKMTGSGLFNTSSDDNGHANNPKETKFSSDSIGRNDSNESFSQPMGNLRIDTPAQSRSRSTAPRSPLFDAPPRLNSDGINDESIPEHLPDSLPSNQIQVDIEVDPVSPCSPIGDVGLVSPPAVIRIDHVKDTSPPSILTPVSVLIPSSLSNKRKTRAGNGLENVDRNTTGPSPLKPKLNGEPFFSSGSLSPPPPEEATHTSRPSSTSSAPRTPQSITVEPTSVRRSGRKVNLEVGGVEDTPGKKATRQSPRTARTRKSMRLS